jgi:phenylpyruvate tautomerase PptA (4-oxalocrotonate tautomerase family)
MPVCLIEGPVLSTESKAGLITNVLHSLVTAYQMPDDRVYINEYSMLNYGHNMVDSPGHDLRVQQDQPRVVASIIAPPGLPKDAKRLLFREITETAANVYGIADMRNILVFLNEHPLDNVASNGYIQTENPEFASPATQN